MKATHSGTCQVCGRLQKLPGGVLSTHGYNVRFGFFSGICGGSDHRPFEVATDCIERSIQLVTGQKAETEKAIADLNAAPITNTAPYHRYIPATWAKGSKSGYKWQTVTLVEREAAGFDRPTLWLQFEDGKADPAFRHSLRGSQEDIILHLRALRIAAYQSAIDERVKYIQWQQRRLDTWKPGKLTPIKEGK